MFDFSFKMSDDTQKYLLKTEKRLRNPDAFLHKVGIVMLRSIDQNFKAQGRPNKWKDISPLTKSLRRKGGGGGSFMILSDSGRLRGSVASRVGNNKVRIGTNVEYAESMHSGGFSEPFEITEGQTTITIGSQPVEARPFVMFQDEDLLAIDALGLKHLEESAK